MDITPEVLKQLRIDELKRLAARAAEDLPRQRAEEVAKVEQRVWDAARKGETSIRYGLSDYAMEIFKARGFGVEKAAYSYRLKWDRNYNMKHSDNFYLLGIEVGKARSNFYESCVKGALKKL